MPGTHEMTIGSKVFDLNEVDSIRVVATILPFIKTKKWRSLIPNYEKSHTCQRVSGRHFCDLELSFLFACQFGDDAYYGTNIWYCSYNSFSKRNSV